MAYYEHVFIARQEINAAQVEGITDKLKKVIEDADGNVASQEYWGLRTLAYRIKKNRKGHYTMLNVDASPAAIAELERQQRLDEDVLRFMTIRVDELEEGSSIVMRQKADKDRRGTRDRGEKGDRGDRGDRFDRGRE